MIEAASRLAANPSVPVLLIAYDSPYPEPLHTTRPIPDSFGVALALASPAHSSKGALLTLETTRETPDTLADGALETLRREIPAARALPLLQLLAREDGGRVTLAYLDGLSLAVEVSA